MLRTVTKRHEDPFASHDQRPMTLPEYRSDPCSSPSVCCAPIAHPAVTRATSDQPGRGEGASRGGDRRGGNPFLYAWLPRTAKPTLAINRTAWCAETVQCIRTPSPKCWTLGVILDEAAFHNWYSHQAALTRAPMGYSRTLPADRGGGVPPHVLSIKILDPFSIRTQNFIAPGMSFQNML